MQALDEADVDEAEIWLQKQAQARGIGTDFRAKFLRTDGDWMYFAVKLSIVGDSSDRAELLQKIEDDWDEQHSNQRWHLLLIPAAG